MLTHQAPRPSRKQKTAEEESTPQRADAQKRLGNSALAEKINRKITGETGGQQEAQQGAQQGAGFDLDAWVQGDGKEEAVVDGVSRPDAMRKGLQGALIGAAQIELGSAQQGGTTVATVTEGTAAELLKTSGDRVQVRVRVGEEQKTGWVAKALFSDQPAMAKDDEHPGLRSDYVFSKFDGDLSPKNPTGKDANQGALGNCFLIGSMAAVANTAPHIIEEMVKYDASKGTYTVRFYEESGRGKFTPVFIDVDGWLPTAANNRKDPSFAGDPGTPLWSAIVEKAYAKWKGGYDSIGDGGVGSEAMEEITGGRSTDGDPSRMKEADVIPYFEAAQKAGQVIYAGSKDGRRSEAQAPFKESGAGAGAGAGSSAKFSADIKHTHEWNEIIPGSFRVQDGKGPGGSAQDTGKEGDAQAKLRGLQVTSGSIDYKGNKAELAFKKGIRPAANDLEVLFQYHGVIDTDKFVIANHAYAFEAVKDGMIQLYNPWGSYQPKPLTPAEFLASYDSLSVNQPPGRKTAGK